MFSTWYHRIFRSLSLKITIVLVLSLTFVLLGITYFNIEIQRSHLIQAVQVSAERASNFAKKALRHGMERNHQEDIWHTITDLGTETGVENIRIYDKQGVIRYSTDHTEVGTTVDANANACTMCHGNATEFTKTGTDQYLRIYSSSHGHRILGFINPIQNERSCWDAMCHAHTPDQTYLGVLDVQMSLEQIDSFITSSTRYLLVSAIITLIAVAAVSGAFVYIGVHKPVKEVIKGTHEIAAGNLSYKINIQNKDEIGNLARSFNRMADELKSTKSKLVEWSTTLEQRVEEKKRRLEEVQAQILHMEKMASLGKLSSMIAHELNNPLSGILTYAKLIKKRITGNDLTKEKLAVIISDISLITDEAKRCGEIVKNLLFFARGHTGEYVHCDICDSIKKSIRLLQHQIDLQGIDVHIDIPSESVYVTCDQNQIQQVMVAIIINALEAMQEGGILTVSLLAEETTVRIAVQDTGVGIEASELQRIFEPFYTTKERGFGTGLGLSIVYGIVKSHSGDVSIESHPGEGSTFTITLPYERIHKSTTTTSTKV